MCPSGRGQVLIPWPNRIAGGTLRVRRAPASARDRRARHAVRDPRPRQVGGVEAAEREPHRVAVRLRPPPAAGYPFALALRHRIHALRRRPGSSTTATNVGTEPCPYGAGAHPYLFAGQATVDTATLRLPAGSVLEPEPRQDPWTAPFDFRSARPVGETKLDHCFTDLERDGDGLVRVVLTSAGGRCPSLALGRRGLSLPDALHGRRPSRRQPPQPGSRADELPAQCLPDRGVRDHARAGRLGRDAVGPVTALTSDRRSARIEVVSRNPHAVDVRRPVQEARRPEKARRVHPVGTMRSGGPRRRCPDPGSHDRKAGADGEGECDRRRGPGETGRHDRARRKHGRPRARPVRDHVALPLPVRAADARPGAARRDHADEVAPQRGRAVAQAHALLRDALPDQLRDRRRHRPGSGVRVRDELVGLLEVRRQRVRRAARNRGPRRLHARGDIPRALDLRVEPPLAARPSGDDLDRGGRHLDVRLLHPHRQLVHAGPAGLQGRERRGPADERLGAADHEVVALRLHAHDPRRADRRRRGRLRRLLLALRAPAQCRALPPGRQAGADRARPRGRR